MALFLIVTEKSKKQNQKSVVTFSRKTLPFTHNFNFLFDPESPSRKIFLSKDFSPLGLSNKKRKFEFAFKAALVA